MKNKKCTAVIVAAGSGKRMGGNKPKQFLSLKGKPIIYYTINAFEKNDNIDSIILVTGADYISYCKEKIEDKYGFKKISRIISGGSERQYSVYNALKIIEPDTDIVLIHDGVRPFIMQQDINKIIEDTGLYGAAVMAVKSKDTVKFADESGFVAETPDRERLWNIQTPQGFKLDIIKAAYDKAASDGFLGTDDSSLAERNGVRVKITEGHYTNIKITTEEDLLTADTFLEDKI